MIRALLFIAVLSCSFPKFAAADFAFLFGFGDSLSDSGNAAILADSQVPPPEPARTPTPISSNTFVPSLPYDSDRLSNGPVWVEYLAASLGLSAAPSLAGGTNFAVGAARTGPSGSGISLLDQVGFFLDATGGIAPPDALYVVWGGGNDARDAFATAVLGGDPASVIGAYAANIASILAQLDSAGAESILLGNVPDIGKTPALQTLGPAAAALGSALAAAMNTALAGVLATLPASLLDDLILFDTFALNNELFADPAAFGMTNVTDACAVTLACIANPDTTFFWDGIHPTIAGHALLARAARAQITQIPAPSSLALLVPALILLGWARRRYWPR